MQEWGQAHRPLSSAVHAAASKASGRWGGTVAAPEAGCQRQTQGAAQGGGCKREVGRWRGTGKVHVRCTHPWVDWSARGGGNGCGTLYGRGGPSEWGRRPAPVGVQALLAGAMCPP